MQVRFQMVLSAKTVVSFSIHKVHFNQNGWTHRKISIESKECNQIFRNRIHHKTSHLNFQVHQTLLMSHDEINTKIQQNNHNKIISLQCMHSLFILVVYVTSSGMQICYGSKQFTSITRPTCTRKRIPVAVNLQGLLLSKLIQKIYKDEEAQSLIQHHHLEPQWQDYEVDP